jgi:hypothetical protein
MSLPTDRDARNAIPLWDGLFSYFPDVWAEVAKVSVLGNKQHNLGKKLFWNREVSTDHLNKVFRHALDHGTGSVLDTDGTFHMAKAVWRACAELQLAIEARRPPPVVSGWATGPMIEPDDKITIGPDLEAAIQEARRNEEVACRTAARSVRQERY